MRVVRELFRERLATLISVLALLGVARVGIAKCASRRESHVASVGSAGGW